MNQRRRSDTFRAAGVVFAALLGGALGVQAADYPHAEIKNGLVTAQIYLPDATHGFYRSTRFDWSGQVYGLTYRGHNYYGPWYDGVDAKVINKAFENGKIINGPPGALQGPVDEFQTPLGWDTAQPGGAFVKIGVGVLRKTDGNYNRYFPYEIVDSGKWTVRRHKDSIEFTQVLSAPDLGYRYVYRKVVRLAKGKPEMVIQRSLKNTGTKEIKTVVYDHNFLVLDQQGAGPDFIFKVPFQIQTPRPPDANLAEVRGNQVAFKKRLEGDDELSIMIQGFSDSSKDAEAVFENSKVGAGLKISGDRPLLREFFWSVRTVLAVEPYIAVDVQPGAEFQWSNTYDYYTLPGGD